MGWFSDTYSKKDGGKVKGVPTDGGTSLAQNIPVTEGNALDNNGFEIDFIIMEDGSAALVSVKRMRDTGQDSIVIPESFKGHPVKRIRPYAFKSCSGLSKVRCIHDLEEIGEGAFENSSIKEVSFKNVGNVGNGAFRNCRKLERAAFSDIGNAGSEAFSGCSSLARVSMTSVHEIGSKAFSNCSKLRFLEAEGISVIGNNAFEGCSELLAVGGEDEDSTINGDYESIGEHAFLNCTQLREVDISAGSISYGCFEGCASLKRASIFGLSSIPGSLFRDCKSLESVCVFNDDLPYDFGSTNSKIADIHSILEIGSHAFDGCGKIEGIILNPGLREIPSFLFRDCKSLSSIVSLVRAPHMQIEPRFPSGIESMGAFSFYGCDKLSSLEIKGPVRWIGDCAFGECRGLKKVVIDSPVLEYLGTFSFLNCDSLCEVTVCDFKTETESVPGHIMMNETGLEKILSNNSTRPLDFAKTLGSEKTWHGSGTFAFFGCGRLYDVQFRFESTDIIPCGFMAYCCVNGASGPEAHVSITIPESVNTIGVFAFFHATNIRSVGLPRNLKEIGHGAFANCTLDSLVLPRSLEIVGTEVFSDALNGESVLTFESSIKDLDPGAFEGCSPGRIRVSGMEDARFLEDIFNIKLDSDPDSFWKRFARDSILERKGDVYEYQSNWLNFMINEVRDSHLEEISANENPNVYMYPWLTAAEIDPELTFDSVVGMEYQKTIVYQTTLLPCVKGDIYRAFRLQPGRNILLYGHPGTGKTMFAKALASEIKAPLFLANCADIVGEHAGEAEKAIKFLFEYARGHKRAVIFFDEFDAIGGKRGRGVSEKWRDSMLATLLTCMQGFNETRTYHEDENPNILIVIAATNRPDMIDPALLRPGRFGLPLEVELPDENVRAGIVRSELVRLDEGGKIDIESINGITDTVTSNTEGYSCADVVEVIRRAKYSAIREHIERFETGRPALRIRHFTDALSKVQGSITHEDMERMDAFRKVYGSTGDAV